MLAIGFVGTSSSVRAAEGSANKTVSLTVLPVCSLSASSETFSKTLQPGGKGPIGDAKTITIACNNSSGYSLYAVGSDGAGAEGETSLVGKNPENLIKTGTAESGDTSAWNFKLSTSSPGLDIAEGYDSSHVIPSAKDLIASRASGVPADAGDQLTIAYSAFVAESQEPDTYTGHVSYTLVQTASVDN